MNNKIYINNRIYTSDWWAKELKSYSENLRIKKRTRKIEKIFKILKQLELKQF